MDEQVFSAKQYETKYRQGYGLVYPESHIIRVHRLILEWELGIRGGAVFDFGCGSGSHLKYFADHGFIPCGCDVSKTAIEQCARIMPEYASNFVVSPPVKPDLASLVGATRINVFLSNQVLYYLDNEGIRDVTRQAYALLPPKGVFIVSMMSYSCWYSRFITGEAGDFKKVDMNTPRQKESMFINFKHREEMEALFKPFLKLHLGSYGSHIREEEGSTDHWLYVGVRE